MNLNEREEAMWLSGRKTSQAEGSESENHY